MHGLTGPTWGTWDTWGVGVVKSLTQNPWPLLKTLELYNIPHLGRESICYLIDLLHLPIEITITGCFVDALLLKTATGCSQLQEIILRNTKLDANAMSAITRANWPSL